MSSSQCSRWLWVVLLAGCNGKLQLDPAASGGDGGAGGRGGAGAPDAGRGPIDHAGESPASGGDGGDSGGGGHAGEVCYPLACSAGSGGSESPGGAGGTAPGGAGGTAPGGAGGAAPGDRGQSCIPGGSSTEADGSPTKTTITTLDRCNGGLACDATKHCVAMPACLQISEPCVLHGVPLGDPYNAAVHVGVVARTGVTAMAADDTHLYWLEYGTRDGLGNYQQDGTLFSYGLADGKLTSLATALPGPYELGVTTGHAYVAVDGGPLVGGPEHAQVLRLPLAGGAAELVQDAVTVGRFATVGDQAFWAGAGLYTVLPTPGASVSTLVAGMFVTQVAADASTVYYNSGLSPIMSVLQTGSTPSVVIAPFLPFALSGDSLYGIEAGPTGAFLDTVPKAGGTWIRKRRLGAEDSPNNLQIIDDRYFFSAMHSADNLPELNIETGLISSDAPPVRLVEVNGNGDITQQMLWVATQETVFWSDGRAILARAVTDK